VARRTLLVIASILLAALGTALIWLYVQGAENRAQQNADLVPALFLKANVSAGQSPSNAVVEQAVPAAVAANAVTTRQELGNQTLNVNGIAGQVLLKSMLSSSGTSAGRFPVGGAASITINDPNRVPADLQPGDTVDIVELSKSGAQLVDGLSNIKVRTVGPAHGQTSGTTSANGSGQNGTIPPTIVGLDIKDAATATKLYGIVARGDQVALYLHNPSTP
jgi:pilus assembly protein CpaB